MPAEAGTCACRPVQRKRTFAAEVPHQRSACTRGPSAVPRPRRRHQPACWACGLAATPCRSSARAQSCAAMMGPRQASCLVGLAVLRRSTQCRSRYKLSLVPASNYTSRRAYELPQCEHCVLYRSRRGADDSLLGCWRTVFWFEALALQPALWTQTEGTTWCS